MIKNQTRMTAEWEVKEAILSEKLKGEEDMEIIYKLESELYETQ